MASYKKYTLKFNANGGTGSMAAIRCEKRVTLPKCTFKRTNFRFVGWAADKPTNPVKFSDGQYLNDVHRDATFYAIWQSTICTIKYNANGGVGRMDAHSCPYGAAIKLRKNVFTREHHTFGGWALSPTGAKQFSDCQTVGITTNPTFYAVWIPNTYYITFETVDGEGKMPRQGFKYGVGGNLNENKFKRQGFQFNGWQTRDSKLQFSDKHFVKPRNNDTLFAKWKTSPYNPDYPYPTARNWRDCSKSTNWYNGAKARVMNLLSTKISHADFEKKYYSYCKNRGCNCFHVFVTNQGDGENAGYSIYNDISKGTINSINQTYVRIMMDRIKAMFNRGNGVILWLMADDSNKWNSTLLKNWDKYCKDLKDLGFLKYASTVCIGLELNEYIDKKTCQTAVNILRRYYAGPIAVHQTSGRYDYASCADLMFFQLDPGDKNYIAKIKDCIAKCGKPVNVFELERDPCRAKCEDVFKKTGAFGVGNW